MSPLQGAAFFCFVFFQIDQVFSEWPSQVNEGKLNRIRNDIDGERQGDYFF